MKKREKGENSFKRKNIWGETRNLKKYNIYSVVAFIIMKQSNAPSFLLNLQLYIQSVVCINSMYLYIHIVFLIFSLFLYFRIQFKSPPHESLRLLKFFFFKIFSIAYTFSLPLMSFPLLDSLIFYCFRNEGKEEFKLWSRDSDPTRFNLLHCSPRSAKSMIRLSFKMYYYKLQQFLGFLSTPSRPYFLPTPPSPPVFFPVPKRVYSFL